ncbi:MAG: hypothetical protein Q9195_009633 [Heterodermia aff. obscurata]
MSSTSPEGMYICGTLLPTLGAVVVGLRFYTRTKLKVELRFDDWAQIPALILDLAIIKIAALAFFRRVFCTHRPSLLDTIIRTLIFLIVIWAIAFIIFYASACGNHPTAAWEGNAGGVIPLSCRITAQFEEAYAITDFAFDLLVLVVPIPSIWALKTSLARKVSITSVFMFALVGLGASMARLIIYVQLAGGAARKASIDAQTQDTQAVWISMLETGLALIAVNLPCVWGLVSLRNGGSSSPTSTKNHARGKTSRRYAGLDDDDWRMHKRESDQTSQDIHLVKNARIDTLVARDDDLEAGYQAEQGTSKDEGINVIRSFTQTETRKHTSANR